jgi:hypothetical protein
MTLPVTIADRFRAAWFAFKQHRKPDPDALRKFMEKRQAERDASIDKLDGYDKALVASIAGKTANWENLLHQVMPSIERLDPADQVQVMMRICGVGANSEAVLHPATRALTAKKEFTRAMVEYTTRKDSTVIVVNQ